MQKHRDLIDSVIDRSTEIAEEQIPIFVNDARDLIETEFSEERARLVALQRVNPTVRDEEITQMDERRDDLLAALDSAQVRPVSVRVLFNN